MVNYKHQKKYLDTVLPEICTAIILMIRENLIKTSYVNSAHVSEFIIQHPEKFPVAGKKHARHLHELLGHLFIDELKWELRTTGYHKNGGRIYTIPHPPSEKKDVVIDILTKEKIKLLGSTIGN